MSRSSKTRLQKQAVKQALSLLGRGKEKISLLDWIGKRGISIKTPQGFRPFSFDGHEYLREIYAEQYPHKVFEKGAQVAISTYHLLESLWLCDTHYAKVLYYFPTDLDVQDFVHDRVETVIRENEYLNSRVIGTDNVGLKQIADSSIYFRGMFSKMRVKSVDGDCIVLDELDEAKQEHKDFARDRILHSSLRWMRELSQPSIADYGIDAAFHESDQRFWHLKCPSCGHWNCLEETFPDCILPLSKGDPRFPALRHYRGCIKCGTELNLDQGEWVAKYPSRTDVRGYHLSQLFSSITTADEIEAAHRKARRSTQKVRFFNSILGFPYAGERQPVTDAVLDMCEEEYGFEPSAEWSYMGVDVGDLLHIVVGTRDILGRGRFHWLEITDRWERLGRLMHAHNVRACVIDAMPYKNSARSFAAAFPGKVWLQYFKRTRKGGEPEQDEEAKAGVVVPTIDVDRDMSLDDTTDDFRSGRFVIPAMGAMIGEDLATLETFRRHLKMLVKEEVTDAAGNTRLSYKRSVENHFGMAANSFRLAMEMADVTADVFSQAYKVYA